MESERGQGYNLTVPTRQANYENDMYYSPSYHHITISDLQPATTYYYKPVIHSNLRPFTKYENKKVTKEFMSQHSNLEFVDHFHY